MQTALLIGATGLVGSEILTQLLQDDRYSKVTVLHRRTTGVSDPKLEEHIIDFDKPEDFKQFVVGDHLYSAMGTTIKQAGSKEAQYLVDYTYPYEVARIAANQGVEKYALVSSGGADAQKKNFYLRIKGELDDAVQELGFKQCTILRPSFLVGNRTESRIGEKAGIFFFGLIDWLPWVRKFRPIQASTVARVMIEDLNHDTNDAVHLFEFEEIFNQFPS